MTTRRPLRVTRQLTHLLSDDKRVILRHLDFHHPPRIRSIVRRVLRLSGQRVSGELKKVRSGFAGRHRDLEAAFRNSYAQTSRHLGAMKTMTAQQQLLVGAYLTMEYSIEAAALFNPSIVPHPDQGGLPSGSVRFLMSLRATGEGHVSSIVFRRGVMDRTGSIAFDPPPRYAYTTSPTADMPLAKGPYACKIRDHGLDQGQVAAVLEKLPDPFRPSQLRAALKSLRRSGGIGAGPKRLAAAMLWMAHANYRLHFPEDCLPSETVIFPATKHESRGMEDVRLVRFEAGGCARYYGTYTAYDGFRTYPMLLETSDFCDFSLCTLSGRYAKNKGMALFPRKLDGQYAMLSRHDGENLYLLRSHTPYAWNVAKKLHSPREPWELVQVGNCGSPLDTDAGWLVLTHGVGPMRQYCISAILLDRQDPSRMIGRLRQPLLVPKAEEREGYVPNVVYSCGSMIHRGRLVIPYAMSDSRTSFATVSVRSLVRRLVNSGP